MDTTRENIASRPPTSTTPAGEKPSNQRIFVVGGATSPIGIAFIEELSQMALHHQQRLPASFSQFDSSPQICIKAIVDGNDNHKQAKDQLAHLPFVEIVLLPDWIDDAACGSGESATSTAATTTSSSSASSTFNNPKTDSGNVNNSPKAAPLTSPYSSPALSLSAQRRVNSLRQVMYGASRAFLVLETNHHLFELETVFIDACMATPTMEYLLRVSTASPVISPHFNQLQIQDLQEKNERFLTGEDAVPFDVPYFGYHQWLVDCYLNRVSPVASGLAGSSIGGSPASSSPTTLGSSRLGISSSSSSSSSSHSQQVARARRPSFSTFPLVANNTNWGLSEGHPTSSTSASSSSQPKPSGLAWTVLRPDWFMQNALPFFQGSLQAEGRAFLPADPAHPFALIDARDIGALSARLLGLEDVELIRSRLHGKFLELHGPRMSSFQELIQALHQQTQVHFSNPSGRQQSEEQQPLLSKPQQQQQQQQQGGGGGGVSSLPDWKAVRVSGKQWMEKMRQYRPECRQEVLEGVVQMFRIMTGEWPQAVDYSPETSAILKEFGMPQRTVEDFARDYASHFLPSGFAGGSSSASSSTSGTSTGIGSAPMAKSKGPQDVKETGERYAAGTFSGLH